MSPASEAPLALPRLDWAAYSAECTSPELDDLLTSVYGNSTEDAKGMNSYWHARHWRADDDRRLATMMWGGKNPDPFAFATSEDAGLLSLALTTSGMPLRLTRGDVCIDVEYPGAFDRLYEELCLVAVKSGLNLLLIEDPKRPDRGRTLNVGSRSGRGFVRLYEKGKKEDPSRPDWVRFELELKPQTRAEKAHCATLEPLDLLGVIRWVRVFVAAQFDFAAAAAPARAARRGDDAAALDALVKQYGKVLGREIARRGREYTLLQLLRDHTAGQDPV